VALLILEGDASEFEAHFEKFILFFFKLDVCKVGQLLIEREFWLWRGAMGFLFLQYVDYFFFFLLVKVVGLAFFLADTVYRGYKIV
jgi:hypothetical protein